MNRMFKRLIFLPILAMLISLFGISADAAKLPVNTKLNHPDFGDTSYCPDNRFYDTDNIHAAIWSYGYECNTLNLNGIDDVVEEVLTKVSQKKDPLKYKNRWFSLWTQGDDMSQKNISDLYDAGWNILGLTYYDYWIETVLSPIETAYYEPRFKVIDGEEIKSLLSDNGHDLEKYPIGVMVVYGVSMPCRSCVFYCPEFSFLKKKTVHGYKYYPEEKVFTKVEDEIRYNGYDKNFIDLYYGKKGKDGNGVFVFTTVDLPKNLVVDESEIKSSSAFFPPDASENAKAQDEDAEKTDQNTVTEEVSVEGTPSENAGETDKENTDKEDTEKVVTDKDPLQQDEAENLSAGESADDTFIKVEDASNKEAIIAEWRFKNGNIPADFNSNLSIGWTGANEITVDFDYSGSLPQGTEVTLYIPFNKSGFQNGDVLYLYYCNPVTGANDLAGTGIYDDGLVTFVMSHCSVYLITDEDHGATYIKENSASVGIIGGADGPTTIFLAGKIGSFAMPIIVAGAVVVALVAVIIVRRNRKKRNDT